MVLFNSNVLTYPKHLPKVRVPESKGDVGHMKAFGGPFIVCVDPSSASTTSSRNNPGLTVNLGGAI